MNTSWVLGLKRPASTPAPIGTVVTTLPPCESTTAITLLPHPAKSRLWAVSKASALGSSQPASGQRFKTAILLTSISRDLALVLDVDEDVPLPSLAANSGLPPSAMVPRTFPLAASSTVESLLRALKVKTCLVNGSYKMASGRSPTLMLSNFFSVFRSKMVTELSPPLLT